ncbi:MAG: LysR family transcriptional regulator, partial [Comamonadaceae bacterium]
PFGQRIETLYAEFDEVPVTAMEVGSPQNACALVHAGAGIALVDEYSLLGWPMGDFRVLDIEDAPPIIADLVRLRTGSSSPAAQAFMRALRSVLLERSLALPMQEEDAAMHQ